jgi:hypothetical protein
MRNAQCSSGHATIEHARTMLILSRLVGSKCLHVRKTSELACSEYIEIFIILLLIVTEHMHSKYKHPKSKHMRYFY